jgi:ADP-heptose:LPS heptosyltransferase
MIDLNNKTVLISRVDSIGDVVLTLPLCVWIKEHFPACKLFFLGNTYTKPVISCLPQVDEIIEWKELQNLTNREQINFIKQLNIDVCLHVFPQKEVAQLAKQAGIKKRIGTSHRLFHWFTCNVRLNFSRKNSALHESQLNFELLKPFGLTEIPTLENIATMMQSFKAPNIDLPNDIKQALQQKSPTVILHTKSQGSAVEWPLEKYTQLANLLLKNGYQVFYTGTEQEGSLIRSSIPYHPKCMDTTGKMNLSQLIAFISQCETLVACSTGPMHLSGILGLKTIGLFSSIKPIHPGRWSALGKKVTNLVSPNLQPKTIAAIEVDDVLGAIIKA